METDKKEEEIDFLKYLVAPHYVKSVTVTDDFLDSYVHRSCIVTVNDAGCPRARVRHDHLVVRSVDGLLALR